MEHPNIEALKRELIDKHKILAFHIPASHRKDSLDKYICISCVTFMGTSLYCFFTNPSSIKDKTCCQCNISLENGIKQYNLDGLKLLSEQSKHS